MAVLLPVVAVLALGLLKGRRREQATTEPTAEAGAPPASGQGWTSYGAVELTPHLTAFLDALAGRLGRRLVVTSGLRSARAQASAMLKKLEAGEDLHELYKADDLVDELLEAPHDVETWTAIITAQVKRGRLISDHQSGDAVDIDDKDAAGEPLNRAAVESAAADLGAEVLYEDIRSHYHFEDLPNLGASNA